MRQFYLWCVSVVAIALVAIGGCSSSGANGDGGDDDPKDCQIDNSTMVYTGQPDAAWQLTPDVNSSPGYVCPVRDEDFFWFQKTDDTGMILSVHVWNNVTTSQLNLCYAIVPDSDHDQVIGYRCRGSTLGQIDLKGTHYLSASGIYFIKVYEANNAKQDIRNPYLIKISQVNDPDLYEENNTKDQAKTVVANQKGYLSYLGDQDWFEIDVSGTNKILTLGLSTTAATPVDLHYDVIDPDGNPLNSGETFDGSQAATTMADQLALPKSGTYYIKVTDTLGDDSDTAVGYTLTLGLDTEKDANEPNNDPAQATPIASGPPSLSGYIASRGDEDWYKLTSLPVKGIIEIDVNFPLASAITPAVDVLYPDDTTCGTNDKCTELAYSCNDSRCVTGECTDSDKCKGGGICLPSGHCAIRPLVMFASSDPLKNWSVSGNPRHLRTVAPIFASEYYIYVRDYQGQHYDTTNAYSITVTARADNDSNENNGLYLTYATREQDQDLRGMNLKYAKVLTCNKVGTEPNEYYNCGNVTGYLSFRADQDWYQLDGIPDLAETEGDLTQASTKADWGFEIGWTNNSSVIDLNLELFMSGSLRNDDRMITWHNEGVGSGTIGTTDCAYICGEYDNQRPFYLRVQHSDRTLYDPTNSYTLSIKAVRGCPAICGSCKAGCDCYACPNPLNVAPGQDGNDCADENPATQKPCDNG